jgi:hypothetical protein
LFSDTDEVSCSERAFYDAIVLQVLVSLISFFIEDVQEFTFIGDQWVDGIILILGSILGTSNKTVHEVWPGLGAEQKREVTSGGSYRPCDVGSINGACILPSVERTYYAFFQWKEDLMSMLLRICWIWLRYQW